MIVTLTSNLTFNPDLDLTSKLLNHGSDGLNITWTWQSTQTQPRDPILTQDLTSILISNYYYRLEPNPWVDLDHELGSICVLSQVRPRFRSGHGWSQILSEAESQIEARYPVKVGVSFCIWFENQVLVQVWESRVEVGFNERVGPHVVKVESWVASWLDVRVGSSIKLGSRFRFRTVVKSLVPGQG